MNYNLLTEKINNFKEFIEENGKFYSFESHPYIRDHESYKKRIQASGSQNLAVIKWEKSDIGSGKIIQAIKNSIDVEGNNLLVHDNRNGEKGRSDKSLYKKYTEKELAKYESVFYDFYLDNVSDDLSFNRIVEFAGKTYPFLAYLYFLKSEKKYVPIAPNTFDDVFKSLDIEFKTVKKCSWENYSQFLKILAGIQDFLQADPLFENEEIRLLDTHTFLWILGSHMKNWKSKSLTRKEVQCKFEEIEIAKRKIKSTLNNQKLTKKDYLKDYVRKNKLGEISEDIVLNFELGRNRFVEKVSNNNSLGYDVEVKNKKGEVIKRIEVKTESYNRSFILTSNELQKANTYDNYYIYVVKNPESYKPLIQQLKPKDIVNSMTCEPINYRVYF